MLMNNGQIPRCDLLAGNLVHFLYQQPNHKGPILVAYINFSPSMDK